LSGVAHAPNVATIDMNDSFPGKSAAGAERRERARMPVKGAAEVRTLHGTLVGEAVDISAAGVCLTLPEPLQTGALCNVDLRIDAEPGAEGESVIETSIVGRVCFCIEQRAGFRVGVNCALSDCLERMTRGQG
jgi:hypothetical protein